MTKSELRKIYLAKQRALSAEERSDRSRKIAALFFRTCDLSRLKVLHSFIPIEKFKEVDTRIILHRIWVDYPQIQVVVPRVDFETNEIASVKFGRDTAVAPNSWDIEEPTHDEFVMPEEVDIVLVPGLYFDRNGHRVGYGKGFYDRFLRQCRADCMKIGLSYFEASEKIDDVHDGDVRMDAVVRPDLVTRRQ